MIAAGSPRAALHGWVPDGLEAVEAGAGERICAHEEIGTITVGKATDLVLLD